MDETDTIDNIKLNIDKKDNHKFVKLDEKAFKGFEFIKDINLTDDCIDKLYNKVVSSIVQLKDVKKEIKKIREYQERIKSKIRNKIDDKQKNTNPKGFCEIKKVPDKLSNLLGLKQGTKLRRTTVVKLVHQELNNRNLKYEKDKRLFRADKDFKKAFDLDDYVNDLNDPKDKKSFSQFTIHTHISKLYKEEQSKEVLTTSIFKSNKSLKKKKKKLTQ